MYQNILYNIIYFFENFTIEYKNKKLKLNIKTLYI